jgi:hypothetical protein
MTESLTAGIKRPPDIKGRWSAWRVPFDATEARAGLAVWLLHCPGAHPFWSYWVMSLVHLRETPGVHAPKLRYPGAQYELHAFALDPHGPKPDPDDLKSLEHVLTPVDQVHQFHGVCDATAVEMVERLAGMVAGGFSPDTDNRQAWSAIIHNTIEHLIERGVA